MNLWNQLEKEKNIVRGVIEDSRYVTKIHCLNITDKKFLFLVLFRAAMPAKLNIFHFNYNIRSTRKILRQKDFSLRVRGTMNCFPRTKRVCLSLPTCRTQIPQRGKNDILKVSHRPSVKRKIEFEGSTFNDSSRKSSMVSFSFHMIYHSCVHPCSSIERTNHSNFNILKFRIRVPSSAYPLFYKKNFVRLS